MRTSSLPPILIAFLSSNTACAAAFNVDPGGGGRSGSATAATAAAAVAMGVHHHHPRHTRPASTTTTIASAALRSLRGGGLDEDNDGGGGGGMDEMTSMGRSDSYGSMLDVDDVYVGGVEMGASNAHVVPPPPPPSSSSSKSSKTMMMTTTMTTSSVVSAISGLLKAAGGAYVRLLTRRPILTKSLTAGLIFGLSDVCAQFIEGGRASDEGEGKETKAAIISSSRVLDASIDAFSRVLAASLVGILFFGPAAHYWYEAIFRLLPSTSLLSTLQKALLGQIFFGPAFTAVFFGAGMVRHGDFTLGGWYDKVRCDLPAVWRAGLGYWPLVDFISYKIVPVRWIPLFVNFCSFVWTIYLSVVSNDK